jgi:hypothetical protein
MQYPRGIECDRGTQTHHPGPFTAKYSARLKGADGFPQARKARMPPGRVLLSRVVGDMR